MEADKMKQKKKSKLKVVIWSMVGILLAGILAVFLLAPKSMDHFEREKAEVGNITTFYSFSGAVEAKNRKTITSDNAIQVKEWKVEVGDQVKKDDVLLITKQGKEIKTDTAGEITKIYAEKNAELMAGSQLVDIVDYSALKTTVKVDEYDLKFLKIGQEVNVVVNALEKEIKGTVSSISKEANNENGVSYFTATIDLEADNAIKVGMSTEAKILKENAQGITTLSMKAIQFDSKNQPYVFIPSEKGMAVKKYVETGINDGTMVEIKKGLETGDVVMVSTKDQVSSDTMMMHGGNE